ncbi:MAG: helix-turn-helix domain-containing protein, partial [Anaerobutyricum soehngenii]
LALLEMGMSVKQIAKAVNLSIETVQNWIAETNS